MKCKSLERLFFYRDVSINKEKFRLFSNSKKVIKNSKNTCQIEYKTYIIDSCFTDENLGGKNGGTRLKTAF